MCLGGPRADCWVLPSAATYLWKDPSPCYKTGAPQPALVPDQLMMLPAKKLFEFSFSNCSPWGCTAANSQGQVVGAQGIAKGWGAYAHEGLSGPGESGDPRKEASHHGL